MSRSILGEPHEVIDVRPVVAREGASNVQLSSSIACRCDSEDPVVEAYTRHKAQIQQATACQSRETHRPNSFIIREVASSIQVAAAVVRERHVFDGIVEACGRRKNKVYAAIGAEPHNPHGLYAFVEGEGTAHVYITRAITHWNDGKHGIIEARSCDKGLIHSPIRI